MKMLDSSGLLCAVGLSVAVLAGCGGGAMPSQVRAANANAAGPAANVSAAAVAGVPTSHHMVLVMEENQSYSTVVHDRGRWPNLDRLISEGALATHYFANTHPSIGNYFMLTTGQVLTKNDDSTRVWNVDNLARRMLEYRTQFRIYAEGISRGDIGGNSGAYLIRHDPFAMLSDIADHRNVAEAKMWPFTQFATDVHDGGLQEFSYIVPDVYHDAHSASPEEADAWLEKYVVEPLSVRPAFRPGGDGILIVDFDEAADNDTRYGGGQVAAVFWGPRVKRGYIQKSGTVYQHQSMLRMVMEALHLPNPPGKAASAPSMGEFFQ